ncbi:unnamed protein product [Oppiella nova]|uniref:dolichyl-phosphate-mannose--protein mannosyltransferase n=1 Tax=Oppiella nova TaxID=334625 RepID=A0A7R9LX11_9ACAR|nr:unnamed protein product [Oppiella nova]CAG2167724.1 unnamed protein product [Oppiella nova]
MTNFETLLRHKNLVICLASMACYWVSLLAEFVFDDTEAILNNKDVMSDTTVSEVFVNDFWGTKMAHNSSHKSFRPLTVLTFRLIRHLNELIHTTTDPMTESQLNPYLYHLSNLIFYAMNNCFLFDVLNKLLNTFCAHKQSMDQTPVLDTNQRSAFLTTILFTCHPIHSESVRYSPFSHSMSSVVIVSYHMSVSQVCACVGLADLMSSLVALTSLLVYIQFTNSLTIAMLLKEQGITLIGLCVILDIILLFDRKCHIDYKLLLYRTIFLSLGTFVLLVSRIVIMDFKGPHFQRGDNPSSFQESLYLRIINFNYIYAINAWILLYPDWLCFDWSMTCIPLIQSLLDLRIIFIAILWITLLLVLKSSVCHNNCNIRRQLQISIAFGCVSFVPSSNIFFSVGFVVAERALFLPSIGYLLLIISGFQLLEKRFVSYSRRNFDWINEKRLFESGLDVCPLNAKVHYNIAKNAADFGFKDKAINEYREAIQKRFVSYSRRNFDWINEKRLFESGLDVCPLNAKVHYNIAKNAADFGFKDKAINEYREAIRLNPDYEHAFNNLGNLLKDSGNLEESKQLLISAVKIRPTFAAAWMNLGIVEMALKQYKEAEISYLNAIKHRTRYADCYYNLGNLYVKQKRFDDAYRVWRNATQLKPKLLSAFNNLILMLDNTGRYESAYLIALEALEYHSNESSLHFNVANVLGKMGKFNESEIHFEKAIALSPQKANYFANLGVLYHRWKDYPKALNK